MKKLMIAFALIATTVVASAATIDWKYSITSANSADGYNSGYTVYVFDKATWDQAVVAGLTEDTWGNAIDSTTFKYTAGRTAADNVYSSIKSGTTAGTRAKALSDDVVGVGGTLDAYYVILNNNKDPSEYYAQATTFTGRDSKGTEDKTGFGTITSAALGAADWKPTSGGDVPEPTSGLLLLLGVAGLALRRRHA